MIIATTLYTTNIVIALSLKPSRTIVAAYFKQRSLDYWMNKDIEVASLASSSAAQRVDE